MNEIQIFNNPEFGSVRTSNINGEPWFVGKDVCEAFGDTNYRRSLSNIDVSDKGVSQIETPGGKQNMVIINESGLYSLLFQMQPQKAKGVSQNESVINERIEKLHRFKHWVTSEVLPSIRKNGGYIANQENLTPEQIVANALVVAQNIITQKDKQIEEMTPKVNYFDALVDKKLNTNIRDTAKELCIGEKAFVSFLIKKGYVFRQGKHKQLRPYAKYAESGNGLFVLKDKHNERNGWAGQQMYVTPKGKETFRLLLEERE